MHTSYIAYKRRKIKISKTQAVQGTTCPGVTAGMECNLRNSPHKQVIKNQSVEKHFITNTDITKVDAQNKGTMWYVLKGKAGVE